MSDLHGQEREAPFAVSRGEEHPSWSRHAYLCGACGEVSYADDWLAFKYDEEGENLIPAERDDSDPIIRCPVCGTDHKDDESGLVWEGTRKEMLYDEREKQVADPVMADSWIDFWKDRAALAAREEPIPRCVSQDRECHHALGIPGVCRRCPRAKAAAREDTERLDVEESKQ